MSLTVRPMEIGDVPAVAAIDRISFPTPWPAGAFRRELKRPEGTYLALVAGDSGAAKAPVSTSKCWLRRLWGCAQSSSVIGYVGFRLERHKGHITTIALHPDWRGLGLGNLLLQLAIKTMMERGVEEVTLEMRPSNDVARELYRKHGFRVVRSRAGYYRDGEDALLMSARVGSVDYRQRLARLGKTLDERLEQEDIEVGQITGATL